MSLLLAGTSHLPVTAIEFLNNNKVLAGSGNQLFLYDLTSGTLILKLRVFAYSRIYGIISQQNCQQTSSESPQVWQVLVFGSKDWAVVEIKETTAYKVVGHCAVNWIKAAHWVYCLQRNKWLAVLASAHNKAFLCDPYTGETLASAQCEERCILYSAAFYGRELDNLVVASGTVFNHVLLWRPCWSEINDSLVEKRMQAHEGVVFSVAFNRDGSELVSASDDRTLRVWDLSKNSDEDDCLVATLYGHQARVWSGIALKKYIVSASEDGSCRVWARDGKNCGFSAKDSWKQCKKNVWTMAVNDSEELVVSGAADGSICVWSIGSIAGKHLQTTSSLDSIIDLPAQADYLPHSVAAARKSEHIRNFALYSCSGTDPGIITVMDSGCVLQKLPKGDWKMLCFLPGFAGYSMLASTLSGDLIAVGMRDGSVALFFGTSASALSEPLLKKLHKASIQHLTVVPVKGLDFKNDEIQQNTVFDLVTSDSDRMVVWSRIKQVGAVFQWHVMASLGLPGRTRLATAAVDSMLGWMVIGSQNGGIYIFDLPENLCNLSARSQLDKFALATKDAPVLDMAVCFGLAHSDTDITSIILYESSQKRLDSLTTNQHKWLKQSSIVTSGRDGIVQRFEIVVGVQAKTTMIVESSLHMRKGQLANSPLTDSFAEIFIERRTTERVTAGSIGGLYRIAEQVYAVTFYRNRMVIKDASSQMELFSVAFAERNRRWRVHYVDGCNSLYLGFINKLQVSTCPIDLRSHLSNFRLAPGVSSLDIRGISAIQVVGANDRHIVALGGEDCVLRICELDESLEKPVKCLAQARRHSSAIRCVLCVSGFGNEFDLSDQESSRYILTAGASCELRCWRLCIGQQVTLLEWAVAPALSHDSESRIMDLAIVDVNHGQQTILVAAAYSDASICLWRLDLAKNEFVSVARDSSYAHGCCVLSLSVAKIAAGTANSNASDVSVTTTLFSGATDGRIFIWDLSQFVNDSRHRGHCCPYGYLKTIDDTSNSREIGGILQPVTVIDNVHQSGVNTIDTWVLQGTQIAIASGGDDNNLSYFTLDCADLLSQSKDFDCDIQRYENAHASSVQQLKFIDGCRLCSVGTDQRIAIWAVNGSCGIEMTFMECTQVADPSAMTLLLARCTSDSSANNKIDSVDVLVAGIGIESFKVKL